MNCRECSEHLSEYSDHEPAESEARAIKVHLDACEDCRNQLRLMEHMAAATRDLPRHEPSAACLLRISEAIHRRAALPLRTEFGPVLNFDELAEYLRVDRETIGQYLDEIPSFEMGGKLLFRKKSVEAWIESKEMGFGLQRTEEVGGEVNGYSGHTLDVNIPCIQS
ncbi:MAG: helix-turn-helix domain-containing protein [Verrucomicrobia bacterium]|nr:helix-turn-helix domain-containing protein [Verrucomicrobiota bacterium]MCG2680513.1 helix-turn-helix domain-containing protein [Kiritimatiellia bacterium]MBU4248236.1 helix-turn-helix domain-containing protein [Verrucomicrobiota bacterium]MBU4290439.1 helix-turn-helix domain-containing protein [Verrucomicrobiota bacterium]MBU4428853.1 helix-turn-helix domain-containing protein [Verrucomicrobiota bacterium]